MKESVLQKQILDFLKKIHILRWRNNLGAVINHVGPRAVFCKNALAGFPDISGVLPSGRFFCIEVKSATGRLSDKQKEWIEILSKNNVLVIVARDLEDVIFHFLTYSHG